MAIEIYLFRQQSRAEKEIKYQCAEPDCDGMLSRL
jgi:hypothetical protein